MNLFSSTKNYVKVKLPFLFSFTKKMTRLPVISPLYIRIHAFFIPPTERYDPTTTDAEKEYFEAYSQPILSLVHGRVLDIGCGFGYLTHQIANQNTVQSVISVDKISPAEFRFSHNKKITYHQKNITILSDNFGLFDVISSTEFVEHISEQNFVTLLHYIKKHLKKEGFFIGCTPTNNTSLEKFSDSPFHIREYQPTYFKELLLQSGFKNVQLNLHDTFFIWRAHI